MYKKNRSNGAKTKKGSKNGSFGFVFKYFLTRNLKIGPFHWGTTEVVDVMEEVAAA